MDVDTALIRLGVWGKYQMIFYIILSIIVGFSASWHMMAVTYLGTIPTHQCALPPGHTNESIPLDDDGVPLKCELYRNISIGDNRTMQCDSWVYGDEYGPTISSDWDLVCDHLYRKDLAQTIMVVGVICGALVFSVLSDTFGRKPVFLLSQYSMVIVGVINACVDNYYAFCVMRFFVGMCQQGIMLIGFILACELFPATHRAAVGLIVQIFWGVGMCLIVLFAYLIQMWRYLQLLISLFGLVAVPLLWLLPESIPWLVANDRRDEAERILHNAAKFNNVPMPDRILYTEDESLELNEKDVMSREARKQENGLQSTLSSFGQRLLRTFRAPKDEAAAKYTMLDVVRNRTLLKYAVIMCFLWMVNSMVYYGLSWSAQSLAGDFYVNSFFTAVVEIPAYTLCIFLLEKYGRRIPLTAFHIIAGAALIINTFIPKDEEGETIRRDVRTGLSILGKFGITGSFGSVFLYAPEIFPTTLRSQAMGIASIGGRLGTTVAPFASLVSTWVEWLPGTVFGCLSVVAGLLVLLLPETRGRPLPQTIEDIENWKRKPNKLNVDD